MSSLTTVSSSTTSTPRRWRIILYGVFASLVGLGYIGMGGLGVVSPFVYLPLDPPPDIHRWHNTMMGAHIGLLTACCVLATILRPAAKTGVLQFLAINGIITAIGYAFLEGPMISIPFLLPPILLVATHPTPREIFRFKQEGSVSKLLAGLTVLIILALLPDLVGALHLQHVSHDAHARLDHYFMIALTESMLVLAAVFAALKVPGWFVLGIMTGITLSYLGGAGLLVPLQANSWGMSGGIVALAGGLCFIAATVYERRRSLAN